ncbi:hypothetical protein C8R44DRAFT_894941 [Mycena epipterygia]|nr:hypothetical protein C8R44DRAFT_894941 [Mycena epipterygia]
MKVTDVKGRLSEMREERRREGQQAKQQERMMKLKMKELKMRNAHALRMAANSTASHGDSFLDGSSLSGSHYAPSEPTDYHNFDGFNGNATAGPFTSSSGLNLASTDFDLQVDGGMSFILSAGTAFASESDDDDRPSLINGSAITASLSLSGPRCYGYLYILQTYFSMIIVLIGIIL